MATLLVIQSSLSTTGQARQLAQQFANVWQTQHPDGQVIVRDLAANPLPHLSDSDIAAFFSPSESLDDAAMARRQESDDLIAELQAADAVVIGVPMYNFGVPSTLKAYFDRIARAGVTFKYTEQGPVGLIADKPVYLLAARGGQYVGTAADSQTPFLTTFLNFIGLRSLHYVYAEGLNMGAELREAALRQASETIDRLARS